MKPLVYCASPLGFSDAGRLFLQQVVKPAFTRAGLIMVDPWALTPASAITRVVRMRPGAAKQRAWATLDAAIGATNTNAIRRADGLFAVLDGVDVDSGTAAEVGFAAGCGHAMLGYRGDFRLSSDNPGTTVNLQVEHFIRSAGDGHGEIITRQADMVGALRRLRQRLTAQASDSVRLT